MPVLLELLGLASITTGIALIDVPAAFIAGGIFVVVLGVSLDGVAMPSLRRNPPAEQPEGDSW